jgi:hypothetical protein
MALLGAGLGAGSSLLDSIFGGTQQVGSPNDAVQLNPLTGQYYNRMGVQQDQTFDTLNQQINQPMDAFLQRNTNAWLNQVGGYGGRGGGAGSGYLGAAEQAFAPFASEDTANRLSRQASQNVAQQYAGAGQGALRSSSANRAQMEAAITPLLQHQQQLAQMQGGLAGQLMGQGQQLYQQGALQGRGQNIGALSSMYGNQSNAMAAMARPEWYSPTYQQNRPFGDIFGNALSGASSGIMLGML